MAAIVWLSFGHASEQPAASPLAQPSTSPTAQASASSLAQEAATSTQRKKRSPAYPRRTAIAHALAWAARRGGNVGVAVVDSHGVLRGYHAHRQFQSASLAKAMLLVACLRLHPRPAVSTRATLTKMIEESDNASADVIFAQVKNRGLKVVARLAGMQEFEVGTSWIDTEMTAADQARFFYAFEEYLPERARAFARRLLSGITSTQRWGIPAATASAGWKVFFKGGWLGSENETMNQAAWLEKRGAHWSLAVLTEDNPTSSYGWQTQKGVAGLLIGRKPTAGYLAVIHESCAGR
jgi:hypothetical protein